MKFTTILLDNNKIEIGRNFFEKDIVKVNGEIVSSKFAILGTVHRFNVFEGGEKTECRLITKMGLHCIVANFYKNGKLVYESPRIGYKLLMITIITVMILRVIFRYLYS